MGATVPHDPTQELLCRGRLKGAPHYQHMPIVASQDASLASVGLPLVAVAGHVGSVSGARACPATRRRPIRRPFPFPAELSGPAATDAVKAARPRPHKSAPQWRGRASGRPHSGDSGLTSPLCGTRKDLEAAKVACKALVGGRSSRERSYGANHAGGSGASCGISYCSTKRGLEVRGSAQCAWRNLDTWKRGAPTRAPIAESA
jgi:hypothetical protein